MIYLLGGVSKSGKTLVAERLAKQYGFSLFCTDWLMMSLSWNNQTNVNHNDDDDIVALQMEPYLYRLIEQMILTDINIVIEGVHITPRLILRINEKYSHITKSCFLGYKNSSVENKDNELKHNINNIKNKWFLNLPADEYFAFIQEMINRSKIISAQCEANNIKYFEIFDIQNQLEDILLFLELKSSS